MSCISCLEDATSVVQFIEIFSEEGLQLNICDVISQHLWLRPERKTCDGQRICWTCWEALRDFHVFYLRVAELHNHWDWKYSHGKEAEPCAQEIELKPEIVHMADALENLEERFVDSEIKVEAQDIDSLLQIEFIDEPRPKDKNVKLGKRRGRPRKIENAAVTKANKIYVDQIPVANDNDSETELPLSVLLKGVGKTEAIENKSSIVITPDNEKLKSEKHNLPTGDQPPKKRRGRPRKVVIEEPMKPCESVKNSGKEHTKGNVQNNEANDQNQEFSINNDDHENYNVEFEPIDLAGTADSGSSSSYNTDSDESFEPKRKYAIIPKRKVVKPKKYRKRPKPLIPPKRMTREEIEAKNAQQEEYEIVIKTFLKLLSCPKCELLVKNFAEIRAHFRASHNDEPSFLMCCGRKFFTRKTLAEHIYIHGNPEYFKCKTCGQIFNNSRSLQEHEDAHVNPLKAKETKTFPCEKCEKVYSSNVSLENHIFSKHVPKSEYKINCTQCTRIKKFPTHRALKDHIKKSHGATVICDKCGKLVRVSYLKKHHMLEHSDEPRPTPEPKQCQICGAWLRHQYGLNQHMRTIHENQDCEHRCKICNKVSTTARALKRHIHHNHECERKFKCTMCEKAFKRPQDLREHTSVHTGKVLYVCPNCSMTFFSSANMYKHRQRRHRLEWEAERKNRNMRTFNIMKESKEQAEGKQKVPTSNFNNII
ncbi:transcription factor grauzone-like [Rhagoletis pomonella]|nr:transcription factor grauzone-like [Rhagoletis pomonella]